MILFKWVLTVCVLFTWATIFLTYIRFRHAMQVQRQMEAIPARALSPLQPYLAIYGLAMCILLSKLKSSIHFADRSCILRVSRFHPHLARKTHVSGSLCCYWLAGLCLSWLVHGYVVLREWSFRIPRSRNVDLANGRAPEVTDEHESAISKVLNWLY
jgi:amino acid permease